MSSSDVAALSAEFVDFLEKSPEAVQDSVIKQHFQKQYDLLPRIINDLSKQGRIRFFQQGTDLSYGLVCAEEAEKLKGLSTEQRMVLQQIEKAGNMGIWIRELKQKTALLQTTLTKSLRFLETRRLIKSVKSISSRNKKLYMLFDVVPSREITGGPWYNEQEFDHVFIEALSKFVYEVIKVSGMSSLKDLTDKVRASGISKVALGPEEVMSIVNILIYDGKVEQVRSQVTAGSRQVHYKISNELTMYNNLTDTPCGVCPVFDQCSEGNIISPSTCIYMDKWLELQDEL